MKNYKYLQIFLSIFLVLGIASSAGANDISGTWSAKIDREWGGKMEATDIRIILKAEGSTLTGKVILNDRGRPFVDGKIEGEKISFNIKVGSNRRKEFQRTIK